MSFAVLFPGQGAQRAGLLGDWIGGDLIETLETVIGQPFQEIAAADDETLQINRMAQPIIAAFQVARWRMIEPCLPRPALACGYSLGELVAAGCAGLFSDSQTIGLAAERARLMDEAFGGGAGIIAIRGLGPSEAEALASRQGLFVAIRNGEDRHVLAGPSPRLADAAREALALGASVTHLRVSTPSHTPLLASGVAPLHARLRAAAVREPLFPVTSALDGRMNRRSSDIVAALACQIAAPLDWAATLDTLAERGVTVALEMGPGADLARMLRERHPAIAVRSLDEFRSVDASCDWVARAL